MWATLEGIHAALDPLNKLIKVLQADAVSLGRAVELLIPVFKALPESVKAFPPGDYSVSVRLIAERYSLFFHAEAVLAITAGAPAWAA